MKECRKCKSQYKDVYSYCPKCGTPYDINMKRAKVPDEVDGGIMSIVKKTLNIILYIFGGLLIASYLTSITKNPGESIFAILFSLSLFQIFYKLIGDKFNTIDEKYLKIARIALPIIILIAWMICFPTKSEKSNENNDFKNQGNEIIKQEENKKDETKKTEENQNKNTDAIISYELIYKSSGDYGKLVEYEGKEEYFYYFPNGTYEVEATRTADAICFLWLDYNNGYATDNGTAYNNKQKLQFNQNGEKQTLTITDDVHLYNSNNCDYKLIKKD